MNDVFRALLRRFVLVFFDNILVYNRSWKEHLVHLREVLQILKDNELKVKKSKYLWGQPIVEYLGHIISVAGVEADPAKVQNMVRWQIPKTPKKLRGFLGLTGYCHRFIANYGKIAAPLTSLLKNGGFHWIEAATKAFEALKKAMTTALVLALPDFTKPYCGVMRCVRNWNWSYSHVRRKTGGLHEQGIVNDELDDVYL
ncbi:uncharacterized mitochondrial protein AtMg00860-like [Typha latifolia]|uniref:uncharacterized mitochondrial protein AtMg00860-like n=1 Tax=Typha latifolia TaxID=4733 RepID=UPI003C2ABE54